MKTILRLYSFLHAVMAALFAIAAIGLMAVAVRTGIAALAQGLDADAGLDLVEALGILAAAVVALQMAQTITEEEVVRDAHVSGPTRVRRFLSRFLVVVVVALAIETLVATFHAVHEDLDELLPAAAMALAIGSMLAGWGVFIRLNRSAEELEPEAMEEAKEEDRKMK